MRLLLAPHKDTLVLCALAVAVGCALFMRASKDSVALGRAADQVIGTAASTGQDSSPIAGDPYAVTLPGEVGPIVVPVNLIGGLARAVAVQGDHAYLGLGPRLTILDIADPGSPSIAGPPLLLPGDVASVAAIKVTDNVAYMLDNAGSLLTVDVSDPSGPLPLGSYSPPGEAHSLTLFGTYAYLAGPNLHILDVSDPSAPMPLGVYEPPGGALDVAVAGSYAFVASKAGGLRVVNVADPLSPFEVAYLDVLDETRRISLRGQYAYIAGRFGRQQPEYSLRVVDISDPIQPLEVGIHSVAAQIMAVVAAGEYVYLATEEGLTIIDVSDPSDPVEVGSSDTPGPGSSLAVEGSHVYLSTAVGLSIVDVTEPTEPAEITIFDEAWPARKVIVAREHAYVVGERSLIIAHEDDLAAAGQHGIYLTPGLISGLDLAGDFALLAVDGAGFHLVNVSDPGFPVLTGIYDLPGQLSDVAVSGRYAFLATWEDGLHVVDISDPTSPVLVGRNRARVHIRAVARHGHYLYTAGEQGLSILNVDNPIVPVEVAFMSGNSYSVALSENHAYLSRGESGLSIIDVNDPTQPTELGVYNAAEEVVNVTVAGHLLYVSALTEGVHIVDATDRTNPLEIGRFDSRGTAEDMAIDSNTIYLADGAGGLSIARLLRDSVTEFIPLTGGSLSSSSGDSEFIFPAGAFSETVQLKYDRLWTDEETGALTGTGNTFDLTAVYSSTNQPAEIAPNQTYTVTIQPPEGDVATIVEGTLVLLWWDGNEWTEEPVERRPDSNLIVARPNHLLRWTVFGKSMLNFLPTAPHK